MSYDLEVWSVQKIAIPEALPSPEKWARQQAIWIHPGKGWQVVVDNPIGVDPEDVPEQIGSLLPGIAYLTRISLEPGHASNIAHQLLMRSAKRLAKAGHGAIYDPQEAFRWD